MTRLLRAVGVLCCLMALAGLFVIGNAARKMLDGTPNFQFKGSAKGLEAMPSLAMEFVEDRDEVRKFLDQCVPGGGRGPEGVPEGGRGAQSAARGTRETRETLRANLAADNFFVVAYWLLFAGMSAILARRDPRFHAGRGGLRYALWLALFAALCATGAAVADVFENARTLKLIDAPEVTTELVHSVIAASRAKWVLIALATLALAPLFVWREQGKAVRAGLALSALYVIVAALILWGVLAGPPLLAAAGFFMNFLGAAAVGYLFTRRAEWVAGLL